MSIKIESLTTEDELNEFFAFGDIVNAPRAAHWPAIPIQLPFLAGQGPSAEGREVNTLVAREDGKIVARAAAVVDQLYIDHWGEDLGHVILFEALPNSTAAVRVLMDEACAWLKERGVESARTGFGPAFDMAYTVDDYESLPPMQVRQSPAYYHALLKEARFETEKGWVDYKIEVTPKLVSRWEHMVAGAEVAGFKLQFLSEVPEGRRLGDFASTWEEAFAEHWGMSPIAEGEFGELFAFTEDLGMLDVSVIAYLDDEPVGTVLAMPELADIAVLAPGRELSGAERLNFLGIGVRKSARGKGVNLAMAAKCYLALVGRGASHVSYTMVLDDNWPSRRTAEKLGAKVCANYVVYRRSFAAGPAQG
ncbi:MAG TPA: GNAT family N-acetyltransferase [Acidimicrobiales bacterium]|nr:GNAT family N-acetyltransferase [Acidimicrobiales bacterium]